MGDETATGVVFDIQHFSVHDGPGIRTNVFLKGCPIRCAWCCNPESQRFRPEINLDRRLCIACGECARRCPHGAVRLEDGAAAIDRALCDRCEEAPCLAGCYAKALQRTGTAMTVDEVMAEVMKDASFYRGVGGLTVTGGEPFSQPDFTAALLAAAKRAGITTAVETCSCVQWEHMARCMADVDTFLCDIKHVDSEKLRTFAAADWNVIRQNIENLAAAGRTIVARVPVVGGFNATPEEIGRIANFARSVGTGELHLLPYHALGTSKYTKLDRAYPLPDLAPPDRELMAALRAAAEAVGLSVHLNG